MTKAAPPDLAMMIGITLAKITHHGSSLSVRSSDSTRGSGNSANSGGSVDSAAPSVKPSKFTYLARPFIARSDVKVGTVRFGFDIETNGLLLDKVTKIHQIVVTDLDSDRVDAYRFDRIDAALEHLARADYITGQNICRYDLPVLRRLRGWAPAPGCTIVDTLIASRLILPNLSNLDDKVVALGGQKLGGDFRGRHSLEAWGMRLGIPKIGADIEDWSEWTPEMEARCIGDVAITKALYHLLQPDSCSKQAMALEYRAAEICDRITGDGIPYDIKRAELLYQKWTARRAELEIQLQQQLPGMNPNSRKQIGALLEARGWIPEQRTKKTRQPKITDELLERIPKLYPEFAGLAEHYTLGRRLASLADGDKAWSNFIGTDGRIHGAILHIGTPHSRAAHFDPNIAAVPNPKKGKPLAAECRALFHHEGDWVFVSCDQAGLQDRCFAHYLAAFDGGEYSRTYIAGGKDVHWGAATALGLVVCERDKTSKLHSVIREWSKSFRYGFLFGARAKRLGEILTNAIRAARQIDTTYQGPPADGARALQRFEAATPGLKQLRQLLEKTAGRGWLDGLDGRRVPVDAKYKALNRVVTCAEAVICKRWLINVYDELSARFHYGWDGDVVIVAWIHDELVVCCKPEIAKEVGELMVRHAKEPGVFYDLKVPLDAEYKIGKTWAGDDVPEITPLPETAPPIVPITVDHEAEEAAQWLARNGGTTDIGENADSSPEKAPPWEPIPPAGDETADSLGPPVEGPSVAPPAAVTDILSPAETRMADAPCDARLGAAIGRLLSEIGGHSHSSVSETPAPPIVPNPDAVPIGVVKNSDRLGAAIESVLTGIRGSAAPPATGNLPPIGGASSSARNGNGAAAPIAGSVHNAGNGQGAAGEQRTSTGEQARADKANAPSTDPELGPYIYRDPAGKPYARVARTPGRSSRFTQKHWTGQAWADGMPKRKLPYRLPELLAADPADLVCITEGEKDAVNAAKLGFIATTNPNGAKGWNSEKLIPYFAPLKHFVIFEDNDDPGRERTKRIITTLRQFIPTGDIRVVKFPELPEGADVSDWLAQDRSRGRAELLAQIEAAPLQGKAELESVRASDVAMRAIDWLWPDRFAIGKIGVIAGLPDEGKGQILCYLAARITRGQTWPIAEGRSRCGHVIILSAEEDPNDSLVPRLKAAGADLERVTLIKMVRDLNDDGQSQKRMFSLVTDLEKLRQKIIAAGNVVAVFIDPITAYLGVDEMDSYRDTDVRAVLGPLKELAEEMRISVISVMHFNKKVDITNALLRVSNSLAFVGLPRHVYAVVYDADNERTLFVRAKNNDVAKSDSQTLSFRFEVNEIGFDDKLGAPIRAPYIVWDSEYVDISATEAMQAASENKSPAKKDTAKNLLLALLADGQEVLVDEIKDIAKGHDISSKTLQRAKDELKIIVFKDRSTPDGKWYWKLPPKD